MAGQYFMAHKYHLGFYFWWPLHTSLFEIYKMFETLVCYLRGIWLHSYTFTPAKLPPDLGINVPLRSGNDATMSWLRLISTSDHFIFHIRHIQSVWAIDMLSQGQKIAPLYSYTSQVAPRFGDSGSLEEWKWCNLTSCLRLISNSVCFIYPYSTYKFQTLVCCLKGIWLQYFPITPAKLPPDLGSQVHLRSGNDATTS